MSYLGLPQWREKGIPDVLEWVVGQTELGRGHFSLPSKNCHFSGSLESGHDLDDESESVTRTSQDQRAEELGVFWSFIVNMLINLESLPLDRIFQMLKMFAMQGPSAVECDIEELRSFLDEKVRQHELLFSAGQYKLPKT